MAKTATKAGKNRRPSTRSAKKTGTSRPTRSAAKRSTAARSSAADEVVTIDRRRGERRRGGTNSEGQAMEPAPPLERRQKVNRRRQIDPTTCERDYTQQEVEFMNALDDYKRRSGRMFPTCSEVLEVLRGLGYVKLSTGEMAHLQENGSGPSVSAKPMLGDLQSAESSAEAPLIQESTASQ